MCEYDLQGRCELHTVMCLENLSEKKKRGLKFSKTNGKRPILKINFIDSVSFSLVGELMFQEGLYSKAKFFIRSTPTNACKRR